MSPARHVLVIVALVISAVGVGAQSARCRDGSLSYSTSHSGTCSRHGGVAEWLSSNETTPIPAPAKTSAVTHASAAKTPAPATAVAARDARGRIQRSAAARHAFARQTGYPNGRPGYVIDHIIPARVRRRGHARQHAVANDCRWESQGSDRARELPIGGASRHGRCRRRGVIVVLSARFPESPLR